MDMRSIRFSSRAFLLKCDYRLRRRNFKGNHNRFPLSTPPYELLSEENCFLERLCSGVINYCKAKSLPLDKGRWLRDSETGEVVGGGVPDAQ